MMMMMIRARIGLFGDRRFKFLEKREASFVLGDMYLVTHSFVAARKVSETEEWAVYALHSGV